MFKSGALDAATAMNLLSGSASMGQDARASDDDAESKRKRDVLSPSKDSEAASPPPKEAKGIMDSLMKYDLILFSYICIYI